MKPKFIRRGRVAAAIVGLASCLAPAAEPGLTGLDAAARLERLGNAPNQFYPGQGLGSVTDLQLYGGRIFIGYGNTDNRVLKAPLYFDPATGRFGAEAPALDEEMFQHFRIFNLRLYIDGYDPIGNVSNFYRREAGVWVTHPVRTAGTGGHNRDIVEFDGWHFTQVASTLVGIPGIAGSSDDGKTWELERWTGETRSFYGSEFFIWKDVLYMTGSTVGFVDAQGKPVKTEDITSRKVSLEGLHTAPNPGLIWMVKRPGGTRARWSVGFEHSADWFAAEDNTGGPITHFTPFAKAAAFICDGRLFVTDGIEDHKPRRIQVPGGEQLRFIDLVTRRQELYILAARPGANRGEAGESIVLQTTDLIHWNPLFHVTLPLPATALEEEAGAIYLGIGTEFNGKNPNSGNLYRVRPEK